MAFYGSSLFQKNIQFYWPNLGLIYTFVLRSFFSRPISRSSTRSYSRFCQRTFSSITRARNDLRTCLRHLLASRRRNQSYSFPRGLGSTSVSTSRKEIPCV